MDKKYIVQKYSAVLDGELLSKILDKAVKYERSFMTTYTDFLDIQQINKLEQIFVKEKITDYVFVGGYEAALRKLIVFTNDPEQEDHLVLLNIDHKSRGKLSHRDYLGSVTGLGISRDKIGDMLVTEGSGYIITVKEIGEYLYSNLFKIGNVNVHIDYMDINEAGEVFSIETAFKEIKTTVSSLRADSIICRGFGISRGRADELFSAGRVFCNREMISDRSRKVSEGDIFSVRGMGKIIFYKEGERTKKDRIFVVIKKYI